MWFRRKRKLVSEGKNDERNAKFHISLATSDHSFKSNRWACAVRLNQGKEGACVGFGLKHLLACDPAPNHLPVTDADAQLFYEEIKRNDRVPGEFYSGTWIEDGLKLLKKQKKIIASA